MKIRTTALEGAYVVEPEHLDDVRGTFYEALRTEELQRVTGRPFSVAQVNYSVSRYNTLRGLHGVTDPPGQAKFVTCVRGAVRDVIVDLRPHSPTFGAFHMSVLDAARGNAIMIPEGFGHGFLALTDDTCVGYLLSTAHVPGTQIDIDPLDPELAVPWGFEEPPLMSQKDARAQSLRSALASGVLSSSSPKT
ncbi:dTDP-4-dehydrorhamnose 3,5-epimerase family protein [Streptomyces sp. VNUA24]|uniref:dTDP-4-dehydrorhamnose 3,5-epimerase family protein n=1 Tax=Streptomyces sp. VNUA24 TaxID=3031131 RepID=UPI0023B7E9E1|nr:dTDP-4-dehydrorhamnose 3,5-epimerase family protein [Streptomyces sp. VNUA24]WEH14816.1 dTDP-4-dehydrorhamnose 3,5-epimerase family protein [Streptomyces sp. VNUA24]